MVTPQQRREIIKAYTNEPVFVFGTLLKCAACLCTLVVIAWIGIDSPEAPPPPQVRLSVAQ